MGIAYVHLSLSTFINRSSCEIRRVIKTYTHYRVVQVDNSHEIWHEVRDVTNKEKCPKSEKL